MGHDFLDGIDEQFQRLMQNHGSGSKRNGRNRSTHVHDHVVESILTHLDTLSITQKEEVLAFIQKLKHKVE